MLVFTNYQFIISGPTFLPLTIHYPSLTGSVLYADEATIQSLPQHLCDSLDSV